MSHPGTEETLLDEGETASGLWCVLVLGSGFCSVFLFGFGVACVLFPSSCCVSCPFNDDLGTLPTWRPHSWKKMPSCKAGLITFLQSANGGTVMPTAV